MARLQTTQTIHGYGWFGTLVILGAIVVALGGCDSGGTTSEDEQAAPVFRLTVFHNNNGGSQLIHAGEGREDFGGVARFASLLQQRKSEALKSAGEVKQGVLVLSAGDNYEAGSVFNASLERGTPFFDSVALELIGYDALGIGNQEFDLGPEVFADFISGVSSPFVSVNLNFSGEPRLQAFESVGRIAGSVVVDANGEQIGIVGVTTPRIAFNSSPRNVLVDNDIVAVVQDEIDKLTAQSIHKIILLSHLESLENNADLVPQLRGVDIVVAGSGELLANAEDLLLPDDAERISGPYPFIATNADGDVVPIVTTSGSYSYVGRLIVEFDPDGAIATIDAVSAPIRVAGGTMADAVVPDPQVQTLVVEPVIAAIEALDSTIIGSTDVPLDGQRAVVRTRETNLGNLTADALFFQATQLAADFGMPPPTVAMQNGGGIRNDSLIPVGDLTARDTFDIVPFGNFVTLAPNIPATQFKEILENGLSQVESVDGRFLQISGFRLRWNPAGIPQELDDDGNVITPGNRVQEVVLDNGTPLVSDGSVVPDAPALNIATINFLTSGGDQSPYRGAPFTTLGVTDQQALVNYIQQGLGGVITVAQYPEGGEGRINTTP